MIPTGGAEAYSNAGDGRESRHRGISGLNQSPSVISLHDQSKASINQKPKRSSKDSALRNANRGNSSEKDEYADEIKMVTGQYSGPVGLSKSSKKAIGLADM